MTTIDLIEERLDHDDTVEIGSHIYTRSDTDFAEWFRDDGYTYSRLYLCQLAKSEGMYI